MKLNLRRVYEPAADGDGMRVLVDRLWPRGLRKQEAAVDLWARELAPSTALRHWFGHDPEKWAEFRRRYDAELRQNGEAVGGFRKQVGNRAATLLYAARDEAHNHAIVLKDFLDSVC
ncbi:MAG: DUF488 family protein [Mesorhizobium sp.]|nr:DUF488 family protein [Mesorhizobium sp.]MBL8579261.1 DUF488 family protein [Mesorhizobium sp.]